GVRAHLAAPRPVGAPPGVSPKGGQPVADPTTYFTDTYDNNVAKPVVVNLNNFIYIRGKNLSDTDQAGVAYVYWARVADLDRPSRWKNNALLTSMGLPFLD